MAREYESRRIIPPPTGLFPAHMVYEDMEEVLSVGSVGTGTDWRAYRSPQVVLAGNYSWYMITKATTPAVNDYVYTSFYLPFYLTTKVDIDLVFCHFTPSNNISVRIESLSSYNTNNIGYAPIVELRCNDGQVRVRDENQAWQTIGTVGVIDIGYWIIFGMTVDLENKKYVQVRVGQYRLDASAYSFYTLSTFYPCPIIDTRIINISTDRARAYIDNLSVFGHFA